MKKLCILALSVAIALGASAQEKETKEQKDLFKAEENVFKSAKDYAGLETAIGDAGIYFSNPAISGLPRTYAIPGKAAFKIYDDYLLQKTLGQNPDPAAMGNSLITGYDYYTKVIDMEQNVEKPKFLKDAVNTISGHLSDFSNMGSLLWDAKDFKGAYKAWSTYVDIIENPIYKAKAPNDTIVGQMAYFSGLAAWQADELDNALVAFKRAIANGYNQPDCYEYGLRVAAQAKNEADINYFSQEGLNKFGTSNSIFLLYVLNGFIENKEYDKALKMLDEAIAKEPTNDVYFFSKGIIEDARGDFDASIAAFKHATELNPNNAGAYLNMGKVMCEKIDKLDNDFDSSNANAYNKFKMETLNPMMRDAAAMLEKAYQIDADNSHEAIQLLKNIYYNLNDEANLKRVESLY